MTKLIFALLFCATMASALSYHSPAPSPHVSVDCTTVIYGMMDCMDYVGPGSDESRPSESCCSAIDSVVELDPFCLCEAIDASAAMNIPLNMTRIFDLPSTCNISVPDLHNCTGGMTPAAAPGSEPVASPTLTSPPTTSPPEISPREGTEPASDPTIYAGASRWLGNPSSAIAFVAAYIVYL